MTPRLAAMVGAADARRMRVRHAASVTYAPMC